MLSECKTELKMETPEPKWRGELQSIPEDIPNYLDCFEPASLERLGDDVVVMLKPRGFIRPIFVQIIFEQEHNKFRFSYRIVDLERQDKYDLNGHPYTIYDVTAKPSEYDSSDASLFVGIGLHDRLAFGCDVLKPGVTQFRYNAPHATIKASEFPNAVVADVYKTRIDRIVNWVRTFCGKKEKEL